MGKCKVFSPAPKYADSWRSLRRPRNGAEFGHRTGHPALGWDRRLRRLSFQGVDPCQLGISNIDEPHAWSLDLANLALLAMANAVPSLNR